jgi:hypothetical protein
MCRRSEPRTIARRPAPRNGASARAAARQVSGRRAELRAAMITVSPAQRSLLLSLVPLALAVACSRAPERVDLASHERSVFSQSGEDGVLEKIFEVIEPTNRYAVEFGAGDGVKNSNVRYLVVEKGWRGLLIEGDGERAEVLAENYAEYPEVRTLEAWVFPGNIELLFEENGVPLDLDLLVIDIDSNDYYVWRAIRDYRPKVVVIEVNPLFPPPERMVIEFHPMNYWDRTDYFGASLQSLYELGRKKGYELVYHNRFGNNAFFVDRPYFERFGIDDNSPEKLFREPSPFVVHVLDRSPQGRDGVPFAPGNDVLRWDDLVIEKKFRFDR